MQLGKKTWQVIVIILGILTLISMIFPACQKAPVPYTSTAATQYTAQANSAVLKEFNFADEEDFTEAQRGFIATLPEVNIKASDGSTVWTLTNFDFLKQKDAPPTVNPLLWRMAKLNMSNGLFKVTDNIYQVRSFDASNITIVEGDSKIIVIDALSVAETARAAIDLYYQQRGKRPVAAVIYTHSHVDHWGGVKGIISDEEVKSGSVKVIAPEGFLSAAISENAMAGFVMMRRAQYQFGNNLPRGENEMVDAGIGKAYPSGSITLIPPTDTVKATGEKWTIDGVDMVFQLVPGAEAPAEMTVYFPQFRAFDAAEIACPLLHNTLTPRGAEVRDAYKWSYYLNEAIDLYGDKTDVIFSQHNWPRWGTQRILGFLKDQRDMYKYLHDQTLRLMNEGYTMNEIAETIKLPASLAKQWYTRSYYGTVSYNVKSIYQKYLGWYDGNPAHLNPLPPVESGKKYVEYMGGPQAVIAMARKDYDNGEYRWVAQVMNNVVFAYPDNQEARNLEADALEQLAYQSESGVWRNCYLTAASELRQGINGTYKKGTAVAELAKAMTIPMIFDIMGVRLNGPKAEGKTITVNWNFTDTGEKYVLTLENSVLVYSSGKPAPDADATLTLSRATLNSILAGETTFLRELMSNNLEIEGDALKLNDLMSLQDNFDPMFNVVMP